MTELTAELRERQRRHLVVFDDPAQAINAAVSLRSSGYHVVDAHTPFAVHGMDVALGMKESRLPWITLVGGSLGGVLGLGFPIWSHAVDWPLNIGGKGFVAWPAIAPVTFEVIVLLAAFATVGGLLWASRLRPAPKVPAAQPHLGVSSDRFVLVVEERDGAFSVEDFRSQAEDLEAQAVVEGWREP